MRFPWGSRWAGPGSLGRRLVCVACLAALAPGAPAAEPANPPRLASLTWSLTETLLALGVAPVAAAGAPAYREWVAEPELPAVVVDLGRRLEPHLGVLAGTRPELILTSAFYQGPAGRLQDIAPVLALDIYRPGTEALEEADAVAGRLAGLVDRPAELSRLRARLEKAIGGLAGAVASQPEPPRVYVVQFQDAAHVRVFGGQGLYQGVLDRAGIRNAWAGPTNYWGFAVAEVPRLNAPADHLVVIEPVPREAEAMMRTSPVWQALPAVREGRVHRLAPVWAYGGLASAARFAGLLQEALDGAR